MATLADVNKLTFRQTNFRPYSGLSYPQDGITAHQFLRLRPHINGENSLKFGSNYFLINGTRQIDKKQIADETAYPNAHITSLPGQIPINVKPIEEPYIREDPDCDMAP